MFSRLSLVFFLVLKLYLSLSPCFPPSLPSPVPFVAFLPLDVLRQGLAVQQTPYRLQEPHPIRPPVPLPGYKLLSLGLGGIQVGIIS
jgi:hypothetical protein